MPIDELGVPAAWQWRMRVRSAPFDEWGNWHEWREGHHNMSSTETQFAQYEERPLYAAAAIERLLAEPANLISIIADIREASGLGAKPMLSELAAEIGKLKADRDRLERNRDMWKGQCERQAAELSRARQALQDTKP